MQLLLFSYIKVHHHFPGPTNGTSKSMRESVQDDFSTKRIYNDVQFIITNENFVRIDILTS